MLIIGYDITIDIIVIPYFEFGDNIYSGELMSLMIDRLEKDCQVRKKF